MQTVTQDEFYRRLSTLDVHPRLEGKYPYTSVFRYRDGREVGRIVGEMKTGHAFPVYTYQITTP